MNTPLFDDMIREMGYDVMAAHQTVERLDFFGSASPCTVGTFLNKNTKPVRFHRSVIILADRLYCTGLILQYYLTKYCGTTVLCVAKNMDDVLQAAQEITPDVLILAGYQRNRKNYSAIHELRGRKGAPMVVMWGLVDNLILDICNRYQITCIADRREPIQNLVHTMLANMSDTL